MAASSSGVSNRQQTKKVLCRYFISGGCREGSDCHFSHNRSDKPSMICKFYQGGSCSFGNKCRYDHVRIQPSTSRGDAALTATSTVMSTSSSSTGPATANSQPSSSSMAAKTAAVTAVKSLPRMTPVVSSLRPDAPEFVPSKTKAAPANYAQAVSLNASTSTSTTTTDAQENGAAEPSSSSEQESQQELCPYHLIGQCWYGESCSFLHGLPCDLCLKPVLHPTDQQWNSAHRKLCLEEHEKDMEESFAVAFSSQKTCGICMEKVLEKKGSNSRFGILPGCKHCFCLDCIRKWRASRVFENKLVRACPECRLRSDYVIPSTAWVEEESGKDRLIKDYKDAMGQKHCKYFRKGEALCPFGNQCFYRHETPDGRVVPGDSPRTVRRKMEPRRVFRDIDASSDTMDGEALRDYLLWQFLDERNEGPTMSSMLLELALEDDLDFLYIYAYFRRGTP